MVSSLLVGAVGDPNVKRIGGTAGAAMIDQVGKALDGARAFPVFDVAGAYDFDRVDEGLRAAQTRMGAGVNDGSDAIGQDMEQWQVEQRRGGEPRGYVLRGLLRIHLWSAPLKWWRDMDELS